MATKLVDGEGTRQSWQEGGRGWADKPRQDEGEERTGEAKEDPAAKSATVSILLGRRRQRIRGTGEKVCLVVILPVHRGTNGVVHRS